ncbi:mannose-6-phosphate isomerase, class I [Microbacterium sp. cx-59]|uniref:mannose-6-phosphate isomerase, class I n=1 Tax=Microbacterium sp. cx-59 TaxID=2891207 RepID=UPI001E59E1F3|nr:mannose-6-phosphate isomerase, class I [Microbacterium sp. cx-59]MCC4907831.1 mannose-6-phosphate isomerase, class I [Microbacterium sp. cx-59]
MLAALTNTPRDYAWGSTTLIAGLEGRAPTGVPEAEIWFGDHPGSPARLGTDGNPTLAEWLSAHGTDAETPARLPYLLKLLAAASPLSIQVHPSKAEAEAGVAREDADGVAADAPHRNYKDDNHKPEVIVAISERFEALAGLRDLDATRRLVAALGDSAGVRALADSLEGEGDGDGSLGGDASAALRRTIAWLLSGSAQNTVDDVIAALGTAMTAEFEPEIAAVRAIAEAYPGDPGVVVALLMNYVSLTRGEAVFVPAGVLHAYLSGLGVELMAASDNVLRGGLTPKHIDVDELLRIVDARPDAPPRLAPQPVAEGVEVFAPGIADFELWHITSGADDERRVPLHGPGIALAVAGEPVVRTASGAEVSLRPGAAAFATADEHELVISGAGEVFVAQPGR